MNHPVISADSHVTEAPHTYVDYIDPKWKDKAPRIASHDQLGDVYVVDGMTNPVPMGLVAAAGKPAEEIRIGGVKFDTVALSVINRQAVTDVALRSGDGQDCGGVESPGKQNGCGCVS